MTILRLGAWITGVIALVALGFLAVGLLLPSTWEARAEVVLDVPPEEVFPWVHAGAGWTRWTPVPDEGVEHFGPGEGTGSGYRWDDPGYGKGEFRITAAAPPNKVAYEVEVEGGAIRIQGRVDLLPEGEGQTRVRWEEYGDFGWNPLLGYMAGRMEELQGEQLRSSLETLRLRVLEARTEGEATPAPDAVAGSEAPRG